MSLKAKGTLEQKESDGGSNRCGAYLSSSLGNRQPRQPATPHIIKQCLTVMSSVDVRGGEPFRTDSQHDRVEANKLLNRDGKSWMGCLCTQGIQTESQKYGTNSELRKPPS